MGAGEGTFIWFDLTTPDPERAMAFYRDLLGWSYRDDNRGADGFYRMVSAGDRGIGGLISMAELGRPDDDVSAHFMPYLYTAHVDGATERAVRLGARVFAPVRSVAGVTRFAVLGDPQGGVFAPMQPLMEGGEMGSEAGFGAPLWYELLALDQDAAASFYAELSGLTTTEGDTPRGRYVVLRRGDHELAGIGSAQPGVPMGSWCIYFRVDDIEAVREKVEALGGHNLSPVFSLPGTGDYSLVQDPTGAVFGLLKPIMG